MRCHAAKAGGKSWVKTLESARSPRSGLTGLEPIECPLITPEPYSDDNHSLKVMSGHQISHKLVLQEYTLEAMNAIGVATAWDLEPDDLQAGGLCRGTLTFIR